MSEFGQIIARNLSDVGPRERQAIEKFYELVIQENKTQNLTRLVSPVDFVEGQVLDSYWLYKSGLLDFPALDLGSGAGVPGIICAILGTGPWVLCDSEKKKAEFLSRAASELGISAEVVADRAETWLKSHSVSSITAKAVGPVGRIFGWMRKCSTWNNLVLLKGPSWQEEWTEFKKSPQGDALKISKTFEYEIGAEKRKRVIVKLNRVPTRVLSG